MILFGGTFSLVHVIQPIDVKKFHVDPYTPV